MLRVNGYAFVDFSSDEAANAAIIGLSGADLDGSNLRVEIVAAV